MSGSGPLVTAISDAIVMLETVAWSAVHDVAPDDAFDVRDEIRFVARKRGWRVRTSYRADLRLVSIVRPAPAGLATRRPKPLR